MNITKLQRIVLSAIKENPGIQNNDAELVAAVWRIEGWSDGRSLEDNIKRVSRGESITRRRRELNVMGLINYSEEAQSTRMDAFLKEQNKHSSHEAISWMD